MVFKKNWIFLFITIIVLTILSYLPFYYHQQQTTKNRVYLGAERYTPDYYVYLFYINQGVLGRNSVLNYYTNEPHEGSLVHIEYLLMGKIGSLFHLSLPQIFYIFRSIFLVIYITISFWFVGLFIKNTLLHRLTFLLGWFWGGFFWPEFTKNGLNLKSYFDFYQTPDIFNRLTFEPHKLIGMTLMLILLYFFYKVIIKPASSHFLLLTFYFLLILTGFLHGVTAISIIFTLLLYFGFEFLIFILNKNHRIHLVSPNFAIILIPLIFAALPLLYWQYVFSQNHVWYAVSLWERNFAKIDSESSLIQTFIGFIFMLGPLIILSLIGLKKFLSEHKKFGLLLFSFLLSNIFLFFIGYIFLGTTKHRYHQEPYLIGWSIIATYGISVIFERLKFSKSLIFRNFLLLIPRSGIWLRQTFYLLLILIGIPNALQGLNRQLYQFGSPPNLDFMGYPPKKTYEALIFLKNNSNPNDIILSLPTIGQIIPAIPGRKVVVGDYVHTYKYFDKLPQAEKFYQGNMTVSEAKEFLLKEKVNYVFWSFEEKGRGNLNKYSDFLQVVFNNDYTVIYKTRY